MAVAVTLGAFLVMRHTGLEALMRSQPAAIPDVAVERVAFAPELMIVSIRNTGPEGARREAGHG